MKNLILYIFLILCLVFLKKDTKENFNSAIYDDVRKIINEEYNLDNDMITNLTEVGKKIQLEGLSTKYLNVYGNLNFLPSGSIICFNKSKAPEGWVLCDGKNGTPDLRGRFIKMASLNLPKTGDYIKSNVITHDDLIDNGTGRTKAWFGKGRKLGTSKEDNSTFIFESKINDKGGSDYHKLDKEADELPEHTHSLKILNNKFPSIFYGWNGGHSHSIIEAFGLRKVNTYHKHGTDEKSHNHSMDENYRFLKYNPIPHPSLPSYYILVYIMKI